ncbi:hypothetical protein SIAM614_00797 [Stappia aggregata IAM 12614]|uniref:Uncharacterized protein n=1 Tax=Roseibium aggregatum (strain ATCC 25650 / DSM 13394 / JCM 20685 / NBRC 16684 / NCIMB 2208 / IAM 12614 / B1) TaxID=384765 RepID=A0P2T2_ROSAI|nr:hypothetical protein SIAM614_00797 [Stappia aggregata IAM 12614] [Roseibium aggregatum IAM 12614]
MKVKCPFRLAAKPDAWWQTVQERWFLIWSLLRTGKKRPLTRNGRSKFKPREISSGTALGANFRLKRASPRC